MLIVRTSLLAGILLYLDPGSGSFLIQLVLAALLGIGVAARLYWSKIKAVLTKKDLQALPVQETVKPEE